jgi:hypothetical protein
MAATKISRTGFSQVEPNHISGIVTGQILAQLPVDTTTMGTVIENGRFAKYDYATGKVNLTGAGEWMLIYNEEKLYDERKKNHKDFAMIASNYTDGEITPRLISTVLGDVFTTNAFGGAAKSDIDEVAGIELDAGDKLYVDSATGYLAKTGDTDGPVFEVAKVYTLADGQPAVKIMRIQ